MISILKNFKLNGQGKTSAKLEVLADESLKVSLISFQNARIVTNGKKQSTSFTLISVPNG